MDGTFLPCLLNLLVWDILLKYARLVQQTSIMYEYQTKLYIYLLKLLRVQ